jgi:hypothetical protein
MSKLTNRQLWNAGQLYGDPALMGAHPPGPKRTNAKPEAQVLNAVLLLLKTHPKVAWAARVNSGAYKTPDGRFIRFGFVGCPDILGQMKDGRLLAIETKAPGKHATDDQRAMLDKVTANNGRAGVARCVEDALRIVNGV